jgi:hypothetical protein
MHDILIGGLIAIIVIAQILVAITTSKKISLFKTIVPEANSFETVKAFIPEDQIKTVTVEYILKNLNKFNNPNTLAEPITKKVRKPIKSKAIITEGLISNGEIIANGELDLKPIQEQNNPDKDMIWITKGNLEKKILLKSLSNYKTIGWVPLTDYNINSQS